MDTVLSVYKPVGKTPLEMINLVKTHYPEYASAPISYAGRLDPLAHGVLLLVVGDAIEKRDEYLHLDKQYRFETLFGVSTDTYDYLGLTQNNKLLEPNQDVNTFVNSFVSRHVGIMQQEYPPFSSKTVQGKPLFQWAKEGRLNEIEIPSRSIEIKKMQTISIQPIDIQLLKQKFYTNIALVQGEFRQDDIQKQWEQFFANNTNSEFLTATFEVTCSSGTYVRGIAHSLGQELGCGAIATDILRTCVGKYTLKDALRLE